MSTLQSIWDDPEMKIPGGYVKFETPGDAIAGTVKEVKKHVFADGTVAPQLVLIDDDGTEHTLTAGQVKLKEALAGKKPDAGDRLTVAFTHSESRPGGKEMKHFDVSVEHPTPATADFDAPF